MLKDSANLVHRPQFGIKIHLAVKYVQERKFIIKHLKNASAHQTILMKTATTSALAAIPQHFGNNNKNLVYNAQMDLFTIKRQSYAFAHQINLISLFLMHVLVVQLQIYGIIKIDNVSIALLARVGMILQNNA